MSLDYNEWTVEKYIALPSYQVILELHNIKVQKIQCFSLNSWFMLRVRYISNNF